ncbi:MAG: M14 family zinc carboxypeptidase [Armatimonadota bacterium]
MAAAAPGAPIDINPGDGLNLRILEQSAPDRLIVNLTTPAHNWFAGTFTNLPTDREVTIGFSMANNDTEGNIADVGRWQGLRPVMTYGDLRRYETYEWYRKDEQGCWISGDPFKSGQARFAGNGKLPEQQVIPDKLAPAFLSTDGKYWSAWREVDQVEVLPNLNIFRIKQRFTANSATVAMRIPFTYSMLQTVIARLKQQQLPGVTVEEIGTTPQGRKLQVIRIDDTDAIATPDSHKTVLVIAREHATEHASSWALFGMLSALLQDTPDARRLRHGLTWLLVPIQDPDGSANSTFDRLTDRFCRVNDPATPSEVYDYARFITRYIYSTPSHTIDMSVSLHNVEATECENLFSPFVDFRQQSTVFAVNRRIFANLQQEGFLTGKPDVPWGTGMMTFRLYGWVADHFGSLDLAYEVNDRYPPNRLSLARLQRIGSLLTASLSDWLASNDGKEWHLRTQKITALKIIERTVFFQRKGYGPQERTPYDLIIRAY